MTKPVQLVVTVGLPASGKSTWADEQVKKGGWVKVEKDEIRRVLKEQGWVWSQGAEHRDVLPVRDSQIRQALEQGVSVVSADTNFDPVHQKALKRIAAEYGAEFSVRRFPISVEEAIERDSKRGDRSVGAKVIRDMAKKWKPEGAFPPMVAPKKVVRDGRLMSAIICDIDGTAALIDGRSPYDTAKCGQDKVNEPIRKILRVFHDEKQWQIIYCSGREDRFRQQTQDWLEVNRFPPGSLLMRKSGDFRKDNVVKLEIFETQIRNFYDVEFVLDDRNQVVDMWRGLGLTCLQVAEGDF